MCRSLCTWTAPWYEYIITTRTSRSSLRTIMDTDWTGCLEGPKTPRHHNRQGCVPIISLPECAGSISFDTNYLRNCVWRKIRRKDYWRDPWCDGYIFIVVSITTTDSRLCLRTTKSSGLRPAARTTTIASTSSRRCCTADSYFKSLVRKTPPSFLCLSSRGEYGSIRKLLGTILILYNPPAVNLSPTR